MIDLEHTDVDRWHAWVILSACFLVNFFVIGTIKSYGILYTEIDEHYSIGSGPVAFIGSIIIASALGLGPFANYLAVNTSFRATAFVGGILLGTGYAASFFVTRVEYLFLTFVVPAGLGYGLSFVPCSTIISFYFVKRRALANGIAISAGGIGTMTFSMLYRYLIEEYTLRPTMLIVGAMMLNVCVGASCFRQPIALVLQKKKEKFDRKLRERKTDRLLDECLTENNNPSYSAEENTSCCNCVPDLKFSLFKIPRFALYTIAFTIFINGSANNLILIPSHTASMGFDKRSVAFTMTLFGVCEIVSRILIGFVADKQWIKPQYIYVICMFVGSAFAFIAPFFRSLEYMYVYASVMGFFPASFWSLLPVLVIDVVGLDYFPQAYGLVLLCLAAGITASHPVIGMIKDTTGDWIISFYVTGSLILLSGILMLLQPLLTPPTTASQSEKENEK